MGRRPRPQPHELQLNPQTQEVQAASDEVALILLGELKKQITDRIKAGDLDAVKIMTLTKELRGLLHAIKKPASTLNYMSAPVMPQIAPQGRRGLRLQEGLDANRETLLKSQESFLTNHPDQAD